MHNIENDRWFVTLVLAGRLKVTKSGRVFNCKTKRYIGSTGSGKYPKVSMMAGRDAAGKKIIRHMQIHRLVWLVHRGPIPLGLQLNHKDTNKENPRLGNLELLTPRGNALHAIANGRYSSLFAKGNTEYRKRKTFGNRHGTGYAPN